MAERIVRDDHVGTVRLILGEISDSNREKISKKFSDEIHGILSCQFLRENNEMLINYDRQRITDEYQLLSFIEQLGYSVQLKECQMYQTELRIEGMHCNSCVSNICDAVMDLTGAIHIQLTFLDKLATIVYDPTVLQLEEIIEEIEKLSFQVAISTPPRNLSKSTTNHSASNRRMDLDDQIEVLHPTDVLRRKESRQSLIEMKDDNPQLETCYFTILGMTCASCVDNIQRNLSKIQGKIH